MASPYIEQAAIIVAMSKSLRDLDDIENLTKRAAAYTVADIDPKAIHLLDKYALYAEKIRRKMNMELVG